MSKWKITLILLTGAICALSLRACGYESFGTYHFRLTIEVDTPAGIRSGAGVMAVSYGSRPYLPGGAIAVAKLRGEAVFVDLGNGRNVVALLTHGRRGEDGSSISWLPVTAFTGAPSGWSSTEALRELEARGKRLEGRVELKPALIPTLVTFTDVSDPATATKLDPSNLRYRFGEGYAFKRAILDIASPGIWPFNGLPISWPRWLFSEPVTHEIKKRLPFLIRRDEQLRTLRSANLSIGAFTEPYQAFWRN